MSLEQIRRLKLFQKLNQNDTTQIAKSHIKPKFKRSHPTEPSQIRTLNKNKKYLREEQRNTEIQKSNRILYQKIANNFKMLQESMEKAKSLQKRKNWNKQSRIKTILKDSPRNNYEPFIRFDTDYEQEKQNKRKKSSDYLATIKEKSKTMHMKQLKTPAEKVQAENVKIHQQPKILFYGVNEIDGIDFKIKLLLSSKHFFLIGKNLEMKIMLEMEYDEYMKLHQNELNENPCNIFKFLEIVDQQIRFRKKPSPHRRSEKLRVKQQLDF